MVDGVYHMIHETMKPGLRENDIVALANKMLYEMGSDDVEAIALIRPGVSTDRVASVWPKAEEFGFPNEMAAFGLQFGHGLGLAVHERPIISRLVSLEHPMEIRTGMVFALETYCPATDGYSAARIEEELIVTDTGCTVISLFPAEDLPIASPYTNHRQA
jgi:Xaa-Pro dipeptidase